jgi:hypothetical protein
MMSSSINDDKYYEKGYKELDLNSHISLYTNDVGKKDDKESGSSSYKEKLKKYNKSLEKYKTTTV